MRFDFERNFKFIIKINDASIIHKGRDANAMRTAGAAALVSKDQVMGIHDTIAMALAFFLGKAA